MSRVTSSSGGLHLAIASMVGRMTQLCHYSPPSFPLFITPPIPSSQLSFPATFPLKMIHPPSPYHSLPLSSPSSSSSSDHSSSLERIYFLFCNIKRERKGKERKETMEGKERKEEEEEEDEGGGKEGGGLGFRV